MCDATNPTRRKVLAKVIECASLAPSQPAHFRITLHAPEIAEKAAPGSFIHILPPSPELMLRRPFSLMASDTSSASITILFRIVGKGTTILSNLPVSSTVDIIGPLGNGFPLIFDREAIIIGGGTGAPPLVFLAKKLSESSSQNKNTIKVFLGARDSSTLVCADEFRRLGIDPILATEDGSIGIQGLVTDALCSADFKEGSVVYACGPIPMLAEVAKWASAKKLPCWVSLESKMACGIGACLGCSIPIIDEEGKIRYERVCSEGPVFESRKVAFEKLL